MENLDKINCYCLFCRSGQEQKIAAALRQEYPQLQSFAATRLIPEKRAGQWTEREHLLLPGYIFLYTQEELPLDLRRKAPHIYRILDYDGKIRSLMGEDRDYALWLLRYQGRLKPSRVYCQGDEIQVLSGPLENYKGTIKKVDRHKRRIWVAFDFGGESRVVSLGLEFVES